MAPPRSLAHLILHQCQKCTVERVKDDDEEEEIATNRRTDPILITINLF